MMIYAALSTQTKGFARGSSFSEEDGQAGGVVPPIVEVSMGYPPMNVFDDTIILNGL
jgi:hypothetical protein